VKHKKQQLLFESGGYNINQPARKDVPLNHSLLAVQVDVKQVKNICLDFKRALLYMLYSATTTVLTDFHPSCCDAGTDDVLSSAEI